MMGQSQEEHSVLQDEVEVKTKGQFTEKGTRYRRVRAQRNGQQNQPAAKPGSGS